jgi:hypothetical protein
VGQICVNLQYPIHLLGNFISQLSRPFLFYLIEKKNIDVELLNIFVNTLFMNKVYFTHLEQFFMIVKVIKVIVLKINKKIIFV